TSTNVTSETTCLATRLWQAFDQSGNSATCQQTVTILKTAPALLIRCVDPTHVELSWMAPATGYQLEVCTGSLPLTWTTVPATPPVINGMNCVVLPSISSQKFYRLHKVP